MIPLPSSPAGPLWKEILDSRALPILQGPQQGSPPSGFPSQSSHREKRPTSRAPFNHLLKSWVDEALLGFPREAPYGNRRPSPEPFEKCLAYYSFCYSRVSTLIQIMHVALYMALRWKDPFFDWQILRSRCSGSYSIPRLNTRAVYQLQ
jgi:hypothetical protein